MFCTVDQILHCVYRTWHIRWTAWMYIRYCPRYAFKYEEGIISRSQQIERKDFKKPQGFCLTCQDCTTLGTSECLDPFISDHSGDCDDGVNKCVKHKTYSMMMDTGSVWARRTKVSAVTRGCLQTDDPDGCSQIRIHGGAYIRCICSEDDCNPGAINLPSHTLLFLCLLCLILVTLQILH